jgi:hypothetical protein
MKTKLTLLLSFIVLIKYASAQNFSFGINAGATLASYKVSASSVSLTSKSKTGFTAGIYSSISMGKNASFQPGLNFLQKGGTFKEEGSTDETTLNYLELPMNFVFNTSSSKGKFFAGAGPSFSFGLSGTDKYEDEAGNKQDTKVNFGSSAEDDLKPFEISGNLLAGYQFKSGLSFTLNYNAGLNNILNTDGEIDSKYHNRYFGLRIGYMFHSKKK